MSGVHDRLAREDGGVLLLVALALPLLFLVVGLAAEVGNWFVHKRHLQLQVDAAAFAGGAQFGSCFGGSGYTAIFNEASRYAGAPGRWAGTPYGASQYNGQVGGTNSGTVTVLYQSKTFQSGGPPADDTETQQPCGTPSLMFDVKATEAALPTFFARLVPGLSSVTANAHARVQLRGIASAKPSLPLAVPDINPKRVAVTFVDEATGDELTGCGGAALLTGTTCSYALGKSGPSGGLTLWSASGDVNIPAAGSTVGVRVGVGGQARSCANTAGDTAFRCFDANGLKTGLVAIRSYAPAANAAQPNLPVLDGVWPSSDCSGAPFFSDAAGRTSCGVSVNASIDFGTGATDPTLAKTAGGVKAKLTATVNGTTAPLTLVPNSYDAATHSWRWSTAGFPFTVPVNAGGTAPNYAVKLDWEEQDGSTSLGTCSTTGGNKCKGTFSANAQRVTSATDDNDGPVKLVQLVEPSSSDAPYSLRTGSHTLTITVGIAGNLQLHAPCAGGGSGAGYSCATDPPVLLRFASPSGSRNFAIDCGGGNFRDQLVNGCTNSYSLNAPDVCPDPASPDPPDCADIATGDKTGQVRQGMNDRFAASGCVPNNYPTTLTGDPRIVTLIVTDFSAFDGSGSGTIPVVTFAAFYVTGWDGQPGACNNEPYPGTTQKGDVWGHFIKYVDSVDPASDTPCDPTGLAPCVPAMTR